MSVASFSDLETNQGANQGTPAVSLLLILVPSARAFGSARAVPPRSESEALFCALGWVPRGAHGHHVPVSGVTDHYKRCRARLTGA